MYLAYIRKSRYDRDYAELSVEETLKRHRTILESYARSQNIKIDAFFEEVVSGESLSERPEMQKLLKIVEAGGVDGVLVVDPDRLSRGNSIDQGIITQTFKYSGTKIITPYKTYDPSDEYDEEFFEFNLFMSRKEYNLINRRLIRGRERSAAEGRFMGATAPFGYRLVKIKGEKGNTLEIDPEEAEIIRLMFRLYTEEGLGCRKLADRLNELKIPTRKGTLWTAPVIKTMIENVVYTGKIRYSYKKKVTKLVDGTIKKARIYDHDCPVYEGRHPAIIDEETFQKAQKQRVINTNHQTPANRVFFNVFSGIAYCAECGARVSSMSFRGERRMACKGKNCKMVSAPFHLFEEGVRTALAVWVKRQSVTDKKHKKDSREEPLQRSIQRIDKEIVKLQMQLERTFTLLEQGVYELSLFTERRKLIENNLEEQRKRKAECERMIQNIRNEIIRRESIIPKIEALFASYDTLSAEDKHHMYKEILERITYSKDSKTKEITIEVFPRL